MATINLSDFELDNLLSILRSQHFRPSLLDTIEAQLAPADEPAPKKAKAKSEPAAE